jgi:hypothetical protein
MANSLGRTIEKGEVVVIRTTCLKPCLSPEQRALIVEEGSGMFYDTMGIALLGYWYDGTGRTRMQSTWIDAERTQAFQDEHGRFPEVEAPPPLLGQDVN